MTVMGLHLSFIIMLVIWIIFEVHPFELYLKSTHWVKTTSAQTRRLCTEKHIWTQCEGWNPVKLFLTLNHRSFQGEEFFCSTFLYGYGAFRWREFVLSLTLYYALQKVIPAFDHLARTVSQKGKEYLHIWCNNSSFMQLLYFTLYPSLSSPVHLVEFPLHH